MSVFKASYLIKVFSLSLYLSEKNAKKKKQKKPEEFILKQKWSLSVLIQVCEGEVVIFLTHQNNTFILKKKFYLKKKNRIE